MPKRQVYYFIFGSSHHDLLSIEILQKLYQTLLSNNIPCQNIAFCHEAKGSDSAIKKCENEIEMLELELQTNSRQPGEIEQNFIDDMQGMILSHRILIDINKFFVKRNVGKISHIDNKSDLVDSFNIEEIEAIEYKRICRMAYNTEAAIKEIAAGSSDETKPLVAICFVGSAHATNLHKCLGKYSNLKDFSIRAGHIISLEETTSLVLRETLEGFSVGISDDIEPCIFEQKDVLEKSIIMIQRDLSAFSFDLSRQRYQIRHYEKDEIPAYSPKKSTSSAVVLTQKERQ